MRNVFKTSPCQTNDFEKLENGKRMYTNGEYKKSLQILKPLMKTYKNYKKNDSFYIDLLFSYNNICSAYNIDFPHTSKIDNIMENIETIPISKILFLLEY